MSFQRFSCTVTAALGTILLGGCGEVRELLRMRDMAEVREEQGAHLAMLHNELEMLQEKLARLPPDRSSELARLRQELVDKTAEEKSLEAEISEAYARRRATKVEEENFRRNHVIR